MAWSMPMLANSKPKQRPITHTIRGEPNVLMQSQVVW